MVDAGSGILGWAPASFLVPVDDGDLQEEAKENQQIVKEDRGWCQPMRSGHVCHTCQSLLSDLGGINFAAISTEGVIADRYSLIIFWPTYSDRHKA